jgi:EAL domain-containing protein (putative c-di-GMP-specific phosphodiesterase class I)
MRRGAVPTDAARMDDQADRARRLETALRHAVEQAELRLVYQPKLDASTLEIAGVEALARWETAECGPIGPAEFIAIAEQAGFIDAVTFWVLETCARQWRRWRDGGLDIAVACNISALSLDDVGFPDRVKAICQSEGMPLDRLTLELTETATQKPVRLMDTLSRIRIMGMELSLDDYGTGYSSLLLLAQLPFTEIKIDQQFVQAAIRSDDARIIVDSTVSLAHRLGLTVTAEGVDTEEAFALIRELGCDRAQGYLLSRPLTADNLFSFVARNGMARSKIGRPVAMND